MPRRSKDVPWLLQKLEVERKRFCSNEVVILARERKRFRDMVELWTGDFTEPRETVRSRKRKAGERLEDIMTLGVEVFFLCSQVVTVSTLCDLENHFVDNLGSWWRVVEHPACLTKTAQELLSKSSDHGEGSSGNSCSSNGALQSSKQCLLRIQQLASRLTRSIQFLMFERACPSDTSTWRLV